MGMGIQKGSSNKRGRRQANAVSEINMTPFIDVMLVLLIIFMVTAPLINVGVPVNLPKTSAPQINDSETPLVVTIKKEGTVFIQETEITEETLSARLDVITKQNKETKIYIKADKDRSYGDVMKIMGIIYSAGFKKVMLLGEEMDNKNTKKKES